MAGDRDPKWFFKAVKERIITAEENELISEVAQAIGERRCGDLLDIIAGIEQVKDWKSAVSILVDASNHNYLTPFTFQSKDRKLEPLKYREVVFELFTCSGLEPIPDDTTSLLQYLENEHSFAEASRRFEKYTLNQASQEIHNGNTLFFELPSDQESNEKRRMPLEEKRKQEVERLRLSSTKDKVNITPLWNTSYGRIALAELGTWGSNISHDEFEMVLSVLPVSQATKERIRKRLKTDTKIQPSDNEKHPSNPEYFKLLNSLIEHDTETIRLQGSKHAVPTLNALLFQALSRYQSSESSSDYRQVIQCLTDLTIIRSLDSLATYETLANLHDLRITSPAISALGNYFHDSAVAILLDFACMSRERWIMQASLEALGNQMKKYPEAEYSIKTAIDSNCKNAGHLERLIKRYRK